LRLFNGVASALLVIFNADIAVWPMVALNVTLKHLLHEFDADIQHFNPGFSGDAAAQTDLGFLILTRAETVGLVLARNAGDGSAQVDLDYVVPR
jgi:hypothetical protein